MKSFYTTGFVLLVTVALLSLASFSGFEESTVSQYDMEQRAMYSLGYKIVTRTAAYPEDPYAMPEPYSSEQLVTFAMGIQAYNSTLAAYNFDNN